MKRKVIFITTLSLLLVGLLSFIAYDKDLIPDKIADSKTEKNGVNDTIKPHEDIKVNKFYDKNGNLTRYDSTYTYFYSSDGNAQNQDSVFKELYKQFGFNDNFFSLSPFGSFNPFGDSDFDKLRKHFGLPDINDDFFSSPFSNNSFFNSKSPLEMFQKLDSLQKHFYMMPHNNNNDDEKKEGKTNNKKTSGSFVL